MSNSSICPLPCIIVNANGRKKRGRPGDEAKLRRQVSEGAGADAKQFAWPYERHVPNRYVNYINPYISIVNPLRTVYTRAHKNGRLEYGRGNFCIPILELLMRRNYASLRPLQMRL